MRNTDTHLDFDLDLAVSRSNDNPVYYVQYAHARICSIFRQAEEQGIRVKPVEEVDLSALDKEAEFDLMMKMGEFKSEVEAAAEQRAPHRIVRYVYELASMFHSYYRAERVIGADEKEMQARFALLAAIRTVIHNALRLIGVSAPTKCKIKCCDVFVVGLLPDAALFACGAFWMSFARFARRLRLISFCLFALRRPEAPSLCVRLDRR